MTYKNKFYTTADIPEIPSGYSINPITGEVRNDETNNILNGWRVRGGYISIQVNGKSVAKHKFIADSFWGATKPPTKTVVHHINENPKDNRLKNLKLLTPEEHAALHKGRKRINSFVYYKKLDDQGNEVERIDLINLTDIARKKRIQSAASNGHRTEGFFWKAGDKRIDEYVKKYGMPKDSDWHPCLKYPGWSATKNGLLKTPKGKWTLGKTRTKGGEGYYYIAVTEVRQVPVHKVIWEIFNDEQRYLRKGEEVDHIDGNEKNNNFSNLRVTDRKGNLNNPITIERLRNAAIKNVRNIEQYTFSGKFVKIYPCAVDAASECGVDRSSILSCCNGRRNYSANSLWCFEGNSDKIEKDQENLLFKYDQSWNLVEVYIGPTPAARDTTISISTISKYTNSGKLAPDNYYYYKGPKTK